MKTTIIICVVLLLLVAFFCGPTDARPRLRTRRNKKNRIFDTVVKSVSKTVKNAGDAIDKGVDKVKKKVEFAGQAAKGAGEMAKAYIEMRITNSGPRGYIEGSDKYFHAKGNYKAQKHGPGGLWAAKKISDTRENIQMFLGGSPEDSAADQRANKLGQDGGDISKIRPKEIPPWFRK